MCADFEHPVSNVPDDDAQSRAFPLPVRRDPVRAAALAEMSKVLAEASLDYEAVVRTAVRLVSGFLGDTTGLRLLSDDGSELVLVASHGAHARSIPPRIPVSAPMPSAFAPAEPFDAVVRAGLPRTITGADIREMVVAADSPRHGEAESAALHSLIIVPLRVRAVVIGTLAVWRGDDRPPYTDRDESFVQDLADRAALAVDNARLFARLQGELAERKQAEESAKLAVELLKRADLKRQALISTLVRAQEEERQRIASDVHDDSLQAIAALGIRLQVLRRQLKDPDLTPLLTSIEDTVAGTVSRLRQLLFRLNPASLESDGLAGAVELYLRQVFPDGAPTFRVKDQLRTEPSGDTALILYRIAQEAVVNIHKHAKAEHVEISLSQNAEGFVMTIRDDGRGFDVDEARGRTMPGHLGLRSMRDRAVSAGGWHTVDSEPGAGTVVRFCIPEVAGPAVA